MDKTDGKLAMNSNTVVIGNESIVEAKSLKLISKKGITLGVGVQFIFPNNHKVTVNSYCIVKEITSDGNILHIKTMNNNTYDYNVDSDFNYPSEAMGHLVDPSSFGGIDACKCECRPILPKGRMSGSC